MSDEKAEWIRRKQHELLDMTAAGKDAPTPEEIETLRQIEARQGHPLMQQERNLVIAQMRMTGEI